MSAYKRKFRFRSEQLYYDFKLKRRFPWWWLLLLLLIPLLLLDIRLKVTVDVVAGDGTPIENACVNLTNDTYVIRMPWKSMGMRTSKDVYTSSGGQAVFYVHASPLGMLIRPTLQSTASGTKGNLSASGSFNLHWKRKCRLVLNGEMVFEVRSRVTGQPIEGASIVLTVSDTTVRKLALLTDQAGLASYTIRDPEGRIDTLIVND